MKLKNIFKKTKKAVINSNVVTVDKKQLEKVLGGATEAKLVDFLGRPHS
jgi:hypothetical protein